ncbi:MAG: carboxypeptidase regulatory-like domain-containing protein [Acidobacteria bacterium]|nr:carboxypeptidase regulatory-like domain-containing protein [Acidobacteriota bacterium]
MKSRRMHDWLFVFPLFAALAISTPSLIMAQSADTGALTGVVEDPAGFMISGAEIKLSNIATGQSRSGSSGADGSYNIPLLPPGKYKVTISAEGFQTAEFTSVTINVTQTAVLNCTLEVGMLTETVTIASDAELLQTTTSTLGTLILGEEVTELPLTTRNYTQVLDLSAGVTASVADATELGKGTQKTSVNGANPAQNNYQMDGAPINSIASLGHADDQNVGAGIGIPNPDALLEFKIQTSTFDASYGRNPGANVNVVTKSGTNQLHGTGFFFLRDTSLNANPFFYNRNRQPGDPEKPILDQKQYGFTLGGPAIRDKLLLFGSWQGTRQKNGLSGGGRVDTQIPPIPEGDRSAPGFAAALGAANCGFANWGWTGGANVACDGSNINPVALNILRLTLPDGSYYFPGSGTDGYVQRTFSIPARYEGDQFLANVDYLINSDNTLAGRFFYTRDPQIIPMGYSNLPGNPQTDFYSNHNIVVKLTSLITPTFTNEARFSYQRNWGDIYDDVIDGASPSELGINNPIPDQDLPPWISISNGPGMFNSFRPAQSLGANYQYADQIAWAKGNHTIRAGFEYERVQYFSRPGAYRGWLYFGTFNDFLVGGPGNIFMSVTNRGDGPKGEFDHDYRQNNASAFVQDDWKLSSNLTVNLGLRWEYNSMLNDTVGNMTAVWPNLMATVPVPPTEPTTSGPGLVGYVVPKNTNPQYGTPPDGVFQVDNNNSIEGHPPYTNFAPRVGVAWQPAGSGKLVLRGGFGMFYDRIQAYYYVRAYQESPPYAVSLSYGPFNSYTLENPFPDLPTGSYPSRWSSLACDPDGNNCSGFGSNLSTMFLNPNVDVPLTYQYNVSIQYEFLPRWVLDVAYVSSRGRNLMNSYKNINLAQLATPENPINGQTANTTANVGLRVPHIGFQPTGLQGTYFDGKSNYHALQATVRKAFSYGLTLQASYTFSKSLATLGAGDSSNSNDPLDQDQQYGPSGWNRPHRFILNYQYDLPFGTHQGAKGALLNGWTVSGITTIQSGLPLTFTDSSAGSIYGASGGRAQLCSSATRDDIMTSGDIRNRLGGASGGSGYFNADAFCAAPTGGIYGNGTGWGNTGVGILLGPGQHNWDISFIKNTPIREGHNFQFRTEFYNALNMPQFGNPNTGIRSSTFGQINGTSVNPRIIQFGLKYIF